MGLGTNRSEWDEYEWVDLSKWVPPAQKPAAAPSKRSGASRSPARKSSPAARRPGTGGPRRSPARRPSPRPAQRGRRGPSQPEDFRSPLCLPVDRSAIPATLPDSRLYEPVWLDDGSHRVLLVDLDNIRSRATRWRIRLETVVELARQADVVAFAGQKRNVDMAVPHLAEFADQVLVVNNAPDAADLILIAAGTEVTAKKVHFVVASNDHIFTKLPKRGRVTIVSPNTEQISLDLAKRAKAIIDLQIIEGAARKPAKKARKPVAA